MTFTTHIMVIKLIVVNVVFQMMEYHDGNLIYVTPKRLHQPNTISVFNSANYVPITIFGVMGS